MTSGDRAKCRGSGSEEYELLRGKLNGSFDTRGVSARCPECGHSVGVYGTGVRELYALDYRVKTHYVSARRRNR